MEKKYSSSRLFISTFLMSSSLISFYYLQAHAVDNEINEFSQDLSLSVRVMEQKNWTSDRERLRKRTFEKTKIKTKQPKPTHSECEHDTKSDDDDDNTNCDHPTKSMRPTRHKSSRTKSRQPSVSKSVSPSSSLSESNCHEPSSSLTRSITTSMKPSHSQSIFPTLTPSITQPKVSISASPTGMTTSSEIISASPTGTVTSYVSASASSTGTVTPSVSISASPTGTVTPSVSVLASPTGMATSSVTEIVSQSIKPRYTSHQASTYSSTPSQSVSNSNSNGPSLSSTEIPSTTSTMKSSVPVALTKSPHSSVHPSPMSSASVDCEESEGPTLSANPSPSKKYKTSQPHRPTKIEKSRPHRSSDKPDHHSSRHPQATRKHSTTFNGHSFASVSAASTVEVPWAGLVRSVKQGFLKLNNWWYDLPKKKSLSPIEQQLYNLKDECGELIKNAPSNVHSYYRHRLEDIQEEIDESLKNSKNFNKELVENFRKDIDFIQEDFQPGESFVPITFGYTTNDFSHGTDYTLLAIVSGNLTLSMGQLGGYLAR